MRCAPRCGGKPDAAPSRGRVDRRALADAICAAVAIRGRGGEANRAMVTRVAQVGANEHCRGARAARSHAPAWTGSRYASVADLSRHRRRDGRAMGRVNRTPPGGPMLLNFPTPRTIFGPSRRVAFAARRAGPGGALRRPTCVWPAHCYIWANAANVKTTPTRRTWRALGAAAVLFLCVDAATAVIVMMVGRAVGRHPNWTSALLASTLCWAAFLVLAACVLWAIRTINDNL